MQIGRVQQTFTVICARCIEGMLSLAYTSTMNGSRIKYTYMWTGLRTCAVPSMNGLHTICWFFVQTQRELDAPGILCSPQVRRKLINRVPLTRRMRTAWCVSGAIVYTMFYAGLYSLWMSIHFRDNTRRDLVQKLGWKFIPMGLVSISSCNSTTVLM